MRVRRPPTASLIPDPQDSPPPNPGWFRQVGTRIRTWWPAKMIGTSLGMTVFFAAYFWVLKHPQFPVTVMPLTAIDRLIGFWPGALPVYLSLWLYIALAPSLLVDRRELLSIGLSWVALSIIGLGIFLVWPTIVPRPDTDWSLHPSIAFLKSVDLSGNACPSLHVAFAVFSAMWFARILRQMRAGRTARGINWLWCAGILYSTVATRQHVALDVLAGAALGCVAGAANLYWVRRAA
jgi:membrane-associated phospholipid phosphatase